MRLIHVFCMNVMIASVCIFSMEKGIVSSPPLYALKVLNYCNNSEQRQYKVSLVNTAHKESRLPARSIEWLKAWTFEVPSYFETLFIADNFSFPKNMQINTTTDFNVIPSGNGTKEVFEGLNVHGHGLRILTYGTNPLNEFYKVCLLKKRNYDAVLSLDKGILSFRQSCIIDHEACLLDSKKGCIYGCTLEDDSDRIIYSFKSRDSKSFRISVKDIVKTHVKPVAYFKTSKQFNAFIPLGKQTYCALDAVGDLYTVWLSADNKIHYARQKFSACPHTFIKIAGDKTLKSSNGFKPRVAFLTDKGEIYCTNLSIPGAPTLWYIATVPDVTKVKRLYYDEGSVFIVRDGAKKDEITVVKYEDKTNMMLLCYYLTREARECLQQEEALK